MNVMEKLAAVLSEQSFYEEYKDLATPEAVTAVLMEKVPEATAEDIDRFMTEVSTQLLGENELNEGELDQVAGGVFTITITVAGVVACVKGAAAVGTVVGGVVWYWKHRKCI